MNVFLILFGKLLSIISKYFNLGSGSTWPGHIALSFNKNFIRDLLKNSKIKIILIAGTNGKTTTGKLIQTILAKNGKKVFQNESGANLLNGIASSILLRSSILGKVNYDFAIFEIDENTLPLILDELTPDYLILLNLFRDQLDRYGEINIIAKKWDEALRKLNKNTILFLNADDPQIASLRRHIPCVNVKFFGLNDKKLAISDIQHASDSIYCPNCHSKLMYSIIFYSHLGIWKCPNCRNTRPKLDAEDSPNFHLVGTYNRYNTIAAVSFSKQLNISEEKINSALNTFKPAFGRQEMLDLNGKNVQIFLSKNPTSFNESLRTICSLNAKNLLIVLNDQIPDGHDVSWIWDVDFEDYSSEFKNVVVSGHRTYDMALRLKYAEFKKYETEESLIKATNTAINKTPNNETLYILPTYSAMLDVRKILTGKKIL